MTTKQLEQKVSELEKRISLLESQRPIINVYPYQWQPASPNYPAVPSNLPQWPNGTMPLVTC